MSGPLSVDSPCLDVSYIYGASGSSETLAVWTRGCGDTGEWRTLRTPLDTSKNSVNKRVDFSFLLLQCKWLQYF